MIEKMARDFVGIRKYLDAKALKEKEAARKARAENRARRHNHAHGAGAAAASAAAAVAAAPYVDEHFDNHTGYDMPGVNPANGLPMMGGGMGLDVHGNAFGTDLN